MGWPSRHKKVILLFLPEMCGNVPTLKEEYIFTRRTAAFVAKRIDGFTRATILAWRWIARHVLALAILSSIARIAVAPVNNKSFKRDAIVT